MEGQVAEAGRFYSPFSSNPDRFSCDFFSPFISEASLITMQLPPSRLYGLISSKSRFRAGLDAFTKLRGQWKVKERKRKVNTAFRSLII